MQSAVVYGRLLASHARQLVAPLLKRQTNSTDLRLITAYCGFSKDFKPAKNKFVFGEDACFLAKTKTSDVLGKLLIENGLVFFLNGCYVWIF